MEFHTLTRFSSFWRMLVKTRGHAVCVEVMWLFDTWCDFREVAWPCSDVTFGGVMWLRAGARILWYVSPSNACLLEFVIAIGLEMLACKVYKRGKKASILDLPLARPFFKRRCTMCKNNIPWCHDRGSFYVPSRHRRVLQKEMTTAVLPATQCFEKRIRPPGYWRCSTFPIFFWQASFWRYSMSTFGIFIAFVFPCDFPFKVFDLIETLQTNALKNNMPWYYDRRSF